MFKSPHTNFHHHTAILLTVLATLPTLAATPKKPTPTTATSAPATAASAPQPVPKEITNYVTLLGTFTAIQHHCNTPTVEKQQFQIWLSKVETSLFQTHDLQPLQFRLTLQQAASKPLPNINCPAFLQQWPDFATTLYTNKLNEQSMLLPPPPTPTSTSTKTPE